MPIKMKLFEKITKRVYLKQHRTFFRSNAYKRMLDTYKNPKTFGLNKKDFYKKKILDLGCGSTGYLQKAMEILDCNSVTCCDLGEIYIKDLKKFEKKYIKKKNFLIYKSQNITKKLDFPSNSFDIVFLNGVIAHLSTLSDVKKSLLEAQRVVKKNGYIWIMAGIENRDGIIDSYLIPSLRRAYASKGNKLFKQFIDTLDEKTINFFLNFLRVKLNKIDYSVAHKFIKKFITLDTLVFFQNVLQVPNQLNLEISFPFLKKSLNKCKVRKTSPLKFKRTDIRKFLQPFHSTDDNISKIFYNKHLQVLAKKL